MGINFNASSLKKELVKKGHGAAIELIDCMEKHLPERFKGWLEHGGTVQLRDIASRFEYWSIYDQRTEKLPFFNDVCAIDSARMHLKENQAL